MPCEYIFAAHTPSFLAVEIKSRGLSVAEKSSSSVSTHHHPSLVWLAFDFEMTFTLYPRLHFNSLDPPVSASGVLGLSLCVTPISIQAFMLACSPGPDRICQQPWLVCRDLPMLMPKSPYKRQTPPTPCLLCPLFLPLGALSASPQ